MKLNFTSRFKRSYKKLDCQSQEIIKKALNQIQIDFTHSSLRMKKMEGLKDVWEASANMNVRITFHIEKPDVVILRNCGHHDETLSNP